MAREFGLYMDESYKNNTDSWDEWGCAELVDEEKGIGVSYNFSYDQGESCCAIYPMYHSKDGDYWNDDTCTFKAYDIDFDDADWKLKLEKTMNEYLNKLMEGE